MFYYILQIASKHAIASQYVDTKGNLCLKLRLFSNAETQCTAQQVVEDSDNILCKGKYVTKESHSENCKYYNYLIPNLNKNKNLFNLIKITCIYVYIAKNQILDKNDAKREDNSNIISKHEKDNQTLINKKNAETNTPNSTSSSISSIYNYLTMRRKKTSNESLNTKYVTFNDVHKNNKLRKINNNKDCVNQLEFKRHCPAIFTNWKEISNSKQSKNKSLSTFSTEAQQTVGLILYVYAPKTKFIM